MAATALKAITATPIIFHSLVPEDAVELDGCCVGDGDVVEDEGIEGTEEGGVGGLWEDWTA